MTETDVYARDWLDLDWSPWRPLDPAEGTLSRMPTDPGLYRVRHADRPGLEYVGETGRSTRGRVRALARGTYADEMPFRDPHTAAPCLWAIRDAHGPDLEVSWTAPEVAESKQTRKAIEAALIAVHRREQKESPTANFGRIIEGYRQSSYRKGGLVGGPLPEGEKEPQAATGIKPLPWEDHKALLSDTWMGVSWTTPQRLADAGPEIPTEGGLYRIWSDGDAPPFEYVGQSSNLRSRLYTHRRNRGEELFFSYVQLPRLDAQHKLLEAETELIGAHWLTCGESPADQF